MPPPVPRLRQPPSGDNQCRRGRTRPAGPPASKARAPSPAASVPFLFTANRFHHIHREPRPHLDPPRLPEERPDTVLRFRITVVHHSLKTPPTAKSCGRCVRRQVGEGRGGNRRLDAQEVCCARVELGGVGSPSWRPVGAGNARGGASLISSMVTLAGRRDAWGQAIKLRGARGAPRNRRLLRPTPAFQAAAVRWDRSRRMAPPGIKTA